MLKLLTTRRSVKQLSEPTPNADELNTMFQAATQVPDHANLMPYHFTVIQGDSAKAKLAEILTAAATNANNEMMKTRVNGFVNLAPMIIAVTSKMKENEAHPIPEWEQEATAACAVYALQLAAKAQGFDSAWLTGFWYKTPELRAALNCADNEKVIALLMIGTAATSNDEPKNTDLAGVVSYW